MTKYLGTRLKEKRLQLGFSQAILAEKSGVKQGTISRIERGNQKKSEYADQLALALGCSIEWLVTGKDEQTINEPKSEYIKSSPIPLFTKQSLGGYPKSTTKINISGAIAFASKASNKVFAYIEQDEGMIPKVQIGDLLFVDPKAKFERGSPSLYLFKIEGKAHLGKIMDTPKGLILHFEVNLKGWEDISVKPRQYIGKVVSIIPNWIGLDLNDLIKK